jgi:hypothetical protein
MTVKILIARKFKNANSKNVSEVIAKSRENAMRENGYISSETLCSCDDPNLILVLSMWKKRKIGTTIRIALFERGLRRNSQHYSQGQQNINRIT